MFEELAITFLMIGAILQFFEVNPKNRKISLKIDNSAVFSSISLGLTSILIWLFI